MQATSHEIDSFYCHGLPGSKKEIERLIPAGRLSPHVLAPLDLDGFDGAVLKSKKTKFHLIGFSLGAMTALKIAAIRPEHIEKITLISPAAPLELGDFLPHMAGRPVFNMALKGRIPFSIFTAFQGLGVTIAPQQIVKTMFSGSPNADIALLSDPAFKKALLTGLKLSLGKDNQSYRKAVLSYVQPWAHDLKNITCPVEIHHCTEDNWTPIEMTYALQKAISSDVSVITYEKLGHYSTLQRVLPLILQD